MSVTVRKILTQLEQLAPAALAESWDNVGLLVGDPSQEVSLALVALDVTPNVLDQAAENDTPLIIAHHPIIFSGLKRLNEDNGTVSLLRRLIRENRSCIALHTNLDSAPNGLNTYVASLLGISDHRPLVPSEARPLLKLVVYVPETHVDAVREAICTAGAGHIGHYAECTFNTPGMGTFRPEEGAKPFIGTTGQLEQVREVRLETIVPKPAVSTVLTALFASHPYEEVAYDLFPLENVWPNSGLGRIGKLSAPTTVRAFMAWISATLQTDRLTLVGDAQRQVQTIALCTGGGGDYVESAIRAGADVYVTGEIKHHQALLARQQGITVIEAGHFATERPVVDLLADYLHDRFRDLPVIRVIERDPLQRYAG